jgi:sugar lactone lactonase YvrE
MVRRRGAFAVLAVKLAGALAGGTLGWLLLAGHPALGGDSGPSPQFILTWGQRGDSPGEFHSPIGIAVSPKDEIYVTDVNNARVQKFTVEGTFLGMFDLPRDKPERRMTMAGGIAVDADGLIYVSLRQQHRVVVFTEAGRVVREFGKRGSGDGELYGPGGLILAPDGTVYVADQQNHRVQRFTADGRFVIKWGGHGAEPGQFDGKEPPGSRFGGPHFLARDSRGRIYTTEGAHGRVQQFTPEGQPLTAWGNKSDEPGGFGGHRPPKGRNSFGPVAILVDGHDRVWVSSLNDRVQLFTPSGKYLLGIGGSGSEPGRFRGPHGLALDSRGHLYVADASNHRIQKFAIPEP